MKIFYTQNISKRKSADVIVIPFWHDGQSIEPACDAKEFSSYIDIAITTKDFLAKNEECFLLYKSDSKEQRILFLGLGNKQDFHKETIRKSFSALTKLCRRKKWGSISIICPEVEEAHLQGMVEGCFLANYAFDVFKSDTLKTDPTFLVKEIQFIGMSKHTQELVKKIYTLTNAVHFTRDLVNNNADDVDPDVLSRHAQELKGPHLKVKVLRKQELKKEKMGLLLAVGQGAVKDPALIIMEYRGDPSSKDVTAIVGKGITYDTGGLNLKVGGSMETMKSDMAGAACVLGVIRAASELSIKKNIIGVIAAAENAIGPASYKPGDVVVSHSGKTVEVNDTDAEGRLVLADALSYLQENYKPSRIIDLATLTGGVVIALGEEATGMFCNNDTLAHQLTASGDRTFERVWRLPLYHEYKEALKSSIADLKNSGGRKASAAKGAIFLAQFIKNSIPWAHLDIAGTAYLSEPRSYHTTNATGVGVRLLIDFLEML